MIVLDTHAWLWHAVARERLSGPAREAIDLAERLLVSTVSCFEVATLDRRERIALDRPARAWIRQALSRETTDQVDVDVEIAAHAGALPDPFPGDPADRLIYATSVVRGVRLVTADRAIREFDPARTVW